jgi:hypothetical protein
MSAALSSAMPSTFTPGSTYAIVFTTLGAFLVAVTAYVRLTKRFDVTNRDDYFSARNSQGALSIMMNFFAGGIGGWTFYSVPEVATYAGSLGVAGYALSVIAPLIILDRVTPFMRKNLPYGVTLQDFVALVRAQLTPPRARDRARPHAHATRPNRAARSHACSDTALCQAQRCRVPHAIMASGGRLRSHSLNLTWLVPA